MDSLSVPFYFPCIRHPQEQVLKINLAEGVERNSRLLCEACLDENSVDLLNIDSVFEFLYDTKTKYEYLRQDIQRIKQLFQKVKLTIMEYLDNLYTQIEELQTNVEKMKLIKQDLLDQFLQRQQQYHTDKLAEFTEILSENIKIKNSQIVYKKPFCEASDLQFKNKIERKLKYLLDTFSSPGFKLKCETSIPEGIGVIEFNNTGELLAIGNQICSEDSKNLQIWRIKNEKEMVLVQTLGGHKKQIRCIQFSNKDDSFITGGIDALVIIWQKNTNQHWEWKQQQIVEVSLTVFCVKFSPFDQFIAAGSKELIIWVQEENIWKTKYTNVLQKSVLCLCFSEMENSLVVADLARKISVFIYSQNEWKLLICISDVNQQPRFLSFYNHQDFLSISNNNEIIFWTYQKEPLNYQSQIERIDQIQKESNYCKQLNYVVLCQKYTTSIFEIINRSLKVVQKIEIVGQVVQFSRSGRILAMSSEGKLLLYYSNILNV